MKKSSFWMAVLSAIFGLAPSTFAEDIAPAAKRYADGSAETPDFRKHVMPLLGRLGCNGRACHGSFQGQGGFRLSLFGYDADLDHKGLAERVDLDKPESSYALQKALLEEPHRGGKRFEAGSWEHKLLTAWIKGGAKKTGDGDEVPTLKSVDIEPKEVLFKKDGESVQLKVVGVWSDGAREDITCLCRFQTNDEQVADISKDGLISGKQAGDTHVVVYYDNTVNPIPVLRPVSDKTGDKYPSVETKTKIDEFVQVKLRKLGVVSSEVAGDMEFLRRLSLDLTGTLPSPQEIQAFVADTNPNKRAKKIDELLETPAYAAWWATRLCDWTGNTNNQRNNNTIPREAVVRDWYEWVRTRIESNVPYDQIAEGFVMAGTRNKGESYREMCEDLSKRYYTEKTGAASRDSMPHYWTRNNFQTAEDRTIGFAYNFMGVRIQCAQCHKHPFDQWSQDDFHQFKNFFTHTKTVGRPADAKDDYAKLTEELGVDLKKGNNGDRQRALAEAGKAGKIIPFEEVFTAKVEAAAAKDRKAKEVKPDAKRVVPSGPKARLLGAGDIDLSQSDDPRQPLMEWLRSKDNPFFSKAFVNRVWANYFNVGIVQPADDHNLANPPSNKALLDYLASEFIAQNFDMKWLHREICNSATYQRTWAPNETNKLDERNFSHAVPRRLPAEVAYDAIRTAAANDDDFAAARSTVKGRAISIPGSGGRPGQGNGGTDYALSLFGRSIREGNCDCDRSSEASLLQTVYLQNDSEVLGLIASQKGWFTQAKRELGLEKSKDDDKKKPDGSSDVARLEAVRARFQKAIKKAEDRNDEKVLAYSKKELAKVEEQLAKLTAKPEEKPAETAATPMAKDRIVGVVKSAYLRTLSRLPSDDEMNRSVAYIESSSDPMRGAGDILWALINTKEFIVNH